VKQTFVRPLYKIYPADSITPVNAYYRLKTLGKTSFMFESATSGEKIGRYSFLGVNPYRSIKYMDEDRTPFEEIKKIMNSYRIEANHNLPPFTGGAIGYLKYESIKYQEKISFRPQKEPLIEFFFFSELVIFDKFKSQIFIISNIFNEQDKEKALAKINIIADSLFKLASLPSPIEIKQKIQETIPKIEDNFSKSFKNIKNGITRGDLFQCVLSKKFIKKTSSSPFNLYRKLRTINPSPYMFYLETRRSVLFGSSPETLVKVKKRIVEISPIAGTRPRGKNEDQDKLMIKELKNCPKENAEHLMLVDLARNDVGKVSKPGSVKVENYKKIHKFSNVIHMVSTVKGELDDGYHAVDALKSSFPAGTLTGAPKIKAMEYIKKEESENRGLYGGAVVYMDYGGNLDSAIIIRSAQYNKKTQEVTYQAGAGIVHDSVLENEYKEIFHKASALTSLFNCSEVN
jgi:anthranilate synthase component 1